MKVPLEIFLLTKRSKPTSPSRRRWSSQSKRAPCCERIRNMRTSPATPSSRFTHLKKSPQKRLLLSATGQGTSPAIFTTSGTYARTPTWTWRKLLTLSRASLSFADKALKKSARSSMQNRTGLEDCGTSDWPVRWQRYLSLTAFFGLSEELSVRPESARTKSLLF